MSESKRLRALALGAVCAALGATFGPTFATAAGDSFKDVFVRNTDAEPVPTRAIGTTQVAGTVTLAGTTQVAVANTPTVTVANTTPIPVISAAPTATPVVHHLTFRFGGVPGGQLQDSTAYVVPDGKRLTIDLVTLSDFQNPVGIAAFAINATTGGTAVGHHIAPQAAGTNSDFVTERVGIVADPGSTVHFGAELTERIGSEFLTVFFHGSFTGTLTDAN